MHFFGFLCESARSHQHEQASESLVLQSFPHTSRLLDLRFRLFGFLNFLVPFLFLLFLSLCCSDLPPTGLAYSSKTSEIASCRQTNFTMEQTCVVACNFALSFSTKFLSISVDISGSTQPITLIWVSMERSFPPAEHEYR